MRSLNTSIVGRAAGAVAAGHRRVDARRGHPARVRHRPARRHDHRRLLVDLRGLAARSACSRHASATASRRERRPPRRRRPAPRRRAGVGVLAAHRPAQARAVEPTRAVAAAPRRWPATTGGRADRRRRRPRRPPTGHRAAARATRRGRARRSGTRRDGRSRMRPADGLTGTVRSRRPSPTASWLTALVRDIADFPQPGVTFRDITPLLGDADGFRRAIDELGRPLRRRRGRPGPRHRGPRLHPRRAGRLPPRRRLRPGAQGRQAAVGGRPRGVRSSSTAPTSSRSTATPSIPASGC